MLLYNGEIIYNPYYLSMITETTTESTEFEDLEQIIDLDNVVASFYFEYDSYHRWDNVETPAEMAALFVAKKIHNDYPYTSGVAIQRLLNSIFDNVVNYRKGYLAQAKVFVTLNDISLDLIVCNETNKTLPPTLLNQTYYPSNGTIKVPDEERDINTGGGNGTQTVTSILPQIYSWLVKTNRSPSATWNQVNDLVLFKLSIPTPDDQELAEYYDYLARRDFEKESFEQAKKYTITEEESIVEHSSHIAIPILKQALRSTLNFPQNQRARFHEIDSILHTLKVYGQEARLASKEIIELILSNGAAVYGMKALIEIEEEKGMYRDHFVNLAENYEGNDDMPLRVIADYFSHCISNSSQEEGERFKKRLIELFRNRNGNFDILTALSDETFLYFGNLMNQLAKEEDHSPLETLMDLYFKNVTITPHILVEALNDLPNGILREQTVYKIAESGDRSHIVEALKIVEEELQYPLIQAIINSENVYSINEAFKNPNVSKEYYPILINAIIASDKVSYINDLLNDPRVSAEYYPDLIKVIVDSEDEYYANEALKNSLVSVKYHPALIGAIMVSGNKDGALDALENPRVSADFHSDLVKIIAGSRNGYSINKVLSNPNVSKEYHPILVQAIVDSSKGYYLCEALKNPRVSVKYHPALIDAIIASDEKNSASDALENPKVSAKYHPDLIKIIVRSGDAYNIYNALLNPYVSTDHYSTLINALITSGSAYYANEAIANSRISITSHPALVDVIVAANEPYYAKEALKYVKDKDLRKILKKVVTQGQKEN
jgi:hypothetical protein